MIMIMTVITWGGGVDSSTLSSSRDSTDFYLIDPHHMLGEDSSGIIPGSQTRKTGLKW